MVKKAISAAMILFLVLGSTFSFAGDKASKKVSDLANNKLAKLGTDPIIVSAVRAGNAEVRTSDQIHQIDEKWKTAVGITEDMQVMMDSELSKYLRWFQDSAAYYAEIFVMDNQGANIAMTDRTSDYWQGDEAKFTESFNYGMGSVFVDEVDYDDSAEAFLTQVSVPVMDGDMAIGVITFGIDVDEIE